MSAVAHAAPVAAAHPEPPRAAEGVRPRAGGTTIKVPLRLVVGAQYADAALSTYVKVAALALRREGCTAKVIRIAEFLGTSKSSVERGLRPLINPDPVDGLVEIPTVRRTLRGGTGESAYRVTRPLGDDERFVLIPVRAAEALTPRLLRLYALIAYAVARGVPVTVAELGEMLYHHSGDKKGRHLTEGSARRLVRQLEATGWITVHDREGHQGRHAYEAHRHPLHTVPEAVTTTAVEPAADEQLALWGDGSPLIHDGSGPSDHDGSLATEEDLETDRPEKTGLAGGIRRRRTTATSARDERAAVVDTFGRRTGLHLTRAAWRTVWQVLDPVRPDLAALSGWEWERVVADVLRRLADDTPERLRDRLQRRSAPMRPIDSLDTGGWQSFARWLIGAGMVRHGCEDPDCETGTRWSTQTDCPVCTLRHETATAKAQQEAELAAIDRRLAARREQRQARATDDDVGGQEQHRPVTGPAYGPPPPPPGGDPPHAPAAPAHVGPPPGSGGWRGLVVRERPHDASVAFRERWRGVHAHHLPDPARPATA